MRYINENNNKAQYATPGHISSKEKAEPLFIIPQQKEITREM